MADFIIDFWNKKLNTLKSKLEDNNFEVFICQDPDDAKNTLLTTIIPQVAPRTISWGGSMTFKQTKVYDALVSSEHYEIIDTFDQNVTNEVKLQRRRQSLLVDLFITGTNAVTEDGKLVNLDMIGNRVAAITFGPKNVIVIVGRNKLVTSLDAAMDRIKTYASPANVKRLNMNTPCLKTATCHNCKSPERICNNWTITEKSFPKKRIKVVLINQDMGL